MPRFTALGLMSGSSHDGLDLCAAEFDFSALPSDSPAGALPPVSWRILAAHTEPYPPDWRQRLLALPTAPAVELAKVHADLGHWFGMAARHFLLRHRLQVDLVASHGHTIFHQPHRQFTLQIGCAEALVSHVGLPVVADFRSRDVALGGQGAPLVPYGEWRLFPDVACFINLGGIANLSVFRQRLPQPPAEGHSWLRGEWPHLAYDLCPANLVLNHLAQQHDPALSFDAGGALASTGRVDASLLAALERLSYYQLAPPRSLGREFFLEQLLPLLAASGASVPDQLATVVEHIGLRLEAEIDRFALTQGQVLITGGGAHNPVLMARLQRGLAARGLHVLPSESHVIDFKEALIFGFLGLCTLLRLPNVLPGTTGARTAVVAGAVHLPEAYQRPLL